MNAIFVKAAKKALTEWHRGQWDRQVADLEALTQHLWEWYLERPETQRKLSSSEPYFAQRMVYTYALQHLSGSALADDKFRGKGLYSTDSIKDALSGKSTNKYLFTILPLAMEQLGKSNPGYAEAIKSRYEDGLVPQGADADRLRHALRALRDEVNVHYITAEVTGIGSASIVFPDTRKRNGEHSDPTGEITMSLIEHPELRDLYLEETSWDQIMHGAAVEPVFDLGDGRTYRATVEEAEVLRDWPELTGLFIELTRDKLQWEAENPGRKAPRPNMRRSAAFLAEQERRDDEYRAVLGVPDGAPLPKRIGQC